MARCPQKYRTMPRTSQPEQSSGNLKGRKDPSSINKFTIAASAKSFARDELNLASLDLGFSFGLTSFERVSAALVHIGVSYFHITPVSEDG